MNFNLNTSIIAATQIIAESAPISSSGHTTLIHAWLGFEMPPGWYLDLTHLITLGLIGIVFYHSWFFIARRMVLTAVNRNYQRPTYCLFWRILWPYLFSVFLIDCITSVLYFSIKLTHCIPETPLMLATGFFITILALISTCKTHVQKHVRIDPLTIVVLGTVQGIAIFPGISRMGVTYAAARWRGFSGPRALELSLAIQVPLILGELVLAFFQIDANLWNYLPVTFPALLLYAAAIIISGILLYSIKKMAQYNLMWLWSLYLFIPCLISMLIK